MREKKTPISGEFYQFGGSDEDRTRYLLHAMEALFQVSYGPITAPNYYTLKDFLGNMIFYVYDISTEKSRKDIIQEICVTYSHHLKMWGFLLKYVKKKYSVFESHKSQSKLRCKVLKKTLKSVLFLSIWRACEDLIARLLP